ncbi:F420-dependent oxidoreductase-like protein [Kribbella sp. VKM Ac-2527]|uniref:F420-dependent oxidoreductase-like protein n=1 Tax=Kribbella caucasensis TaxID=2512215 RepID=A0A4R6KK03_9ACTN|nr:LLM class F420-dependent oxidoreductase [Kribbella sp. VKM Ac-2527]TDO51648.1 F420-dependent oxidoreductase-like protein [Kribbella sp. VKM Ac-2527]
MTISLGYQIPKFTYPGGADALFETVVAQTREAEASGFDTVLVMDHFYQLPDLGAIDEPMLEAYSILAALAASSSTVQLAALVSGNTYRNPALLAKTVSTLDVISRGRAILGIGAGWFQQEHDELGFAFDTFTERFQKLEEALEIIAPMLRGERLTFDGKWYQVQNALNEPRYRDAVPIMLGGSGERKTFRLAARFADHINMICPRPVLPHKVQVLHQRCEEIGRDPGTLKSSFLATAIPVDSAAEGRRVHESLSPFLQAESFIGSPAEIAGQLGDDILGAGVDGLIINMPVNGHEPGLVAEMGKLLSPLVAQ